MKIRKLKIWTFRILITCLIPLSHLQATHIVGGEIEFVRVAKYTYDIRLIQYFDQINGAPGAEDDNVNVGIFSKSINSLIDTFLLPKTSVDFVQYSFPQCAIPSLSTKRIIYSRIVNLDSLAYADPQGYYIAWDRCCRNNGINNLIDPGSQGQLFYLEVPPIYKDGKEYINSSPVLFPPVSDYACVGDLFYFDFQGTDPDGDSLVYSMVNPMKGLTGPGNPALIAPFPGPYPDVIWNSSHGLNNMINGNPPLNISDDGFLTVKPNEQGLFVFGIRCEEYRDGNKIGEVRRDFQIYVINCPSNDPPGILGTNPVDSTQLQNGDTIQITLNDRCFSVDIWDPDPNTAMTLEAVALNFDSSFIYPTPSQAVAVGTDTVSLQVCFSKCAMTEDEPYEFWVIVSDDGCALPKKDTIRLYAFVEGFGFQVPGIYSDIGSDTVTGLVGEEIRFEVFGVDLENDSIDILLSRPNWDPFLYGASFPRTSGTDTISSTFSWIPDCRFLDEDSAFLIFRAFDHICTNYDTILRVNLDISYPKYDPLITTSVEGNQFTAELLETTNFDVFVRDSNSLETVQIFMKVLDKDGNQIPPGPFEYNPKSSVGELNSLVSWQPGCDFMDQDTVTLRVFSFDNGCIQGLDSLDLLAALTYTNETPVLEIEDVDQNAITNREISFEINPVDTVISLDMLGFDADSDLVILSAEGVGYDLTELNMSFMSQSEFKEANGQFQWVIPGCKLLTEQNPIDVRFRIQDNSCEEIKDSLLIHFYWEDPLEGLEPPNTITPNGDGLNDGFSLDQIKAPCSFNYVVIYGRWGQEVYYSTDPEFNWKPDDLPPGQYMYHLVFENLEYKGYINLIR